MATSKGDLDTTIVKDMQSIYSRIIAEEREIRIKQVEAVIALIKEGGTVPFISRYRKEKTGNLNEVEVAYIKDRLDKLIEFDRRKDTILKTIEEQGKLTSELRKRIENTTDPSKLEDLYLPFKPKRKTKASVAKDKGLEPLAAEIFKQQNFDVYARAKGFIDKNKEVNTADDALQGARDIIAEWISEMAEVRESLRKMFMGKGILSSRVMRGKKDNGQKYKDYFEWAEPIKNIPSHRLLAMRRGEKEMILSLDISPDEAEALYMVKKKVLKGYGQSSKQVMMALEDSYKRLLKPSIESEVRVTSKEKADLEAINVFSENLKQLLLAPALGQKNIMAIDPGFRTGCKVVCLDRQGRLKKFETIYPHPPQNRTAQARDVLQTLIEKHSIEAIAVGNGTAGRETEQFVKGLKLNPNTICVMVNESGASIYSASDAAREEFPNEDLTVRGAVSIGRRMMDPLAELVKIDAKSIGVGQYQHDVDQGQLKRKLDEVVESCVNAVGVELNTASKQLLTYVSGLGPQLAENIVKHRNENGPFRDRNSLRKVPRLGDKAFEQCAGFLRIHGSKNVLDSSAVHPESYSLVEAMAKDLKTDVANLIDQPGLRKKINLHSYVNDNFGLLTLNDIMNELEKPGRDPRDKFEVFSFAAGINDIVDLKPGMKLPGIVTNITKFGAFVDIGVHQEGLVHISQLADKFVSDPTDVVKLQQKVQATVTDINVEQKRISLSLKADPFEKQNPRR